MRRLVARAPPSPAICFRLERPRSATFWQRYRPGNAFNPRRCSADIACRRDCPNNVGLDDDVARTSDHQQVLDIVAPHQNEPAAAVDARVIDHRESRLPPRGRGPSRPLPNRRTAHAIAPIRPSTIKKATKKRTASGISAPNKLSNIRATPHFDAAPAGGPGLLQRNGTGHIRRPDL